MNPFHLAIQVHDLALARAFYINVLHYAEGRSDNNWVDLNFFGHQLVCHLNTGIKNRHQQACTKNTVDEHGVPVPHFGIVLDMQDWEKLSTELLQSDIKYAIEPLYQI